MQDYADLYKRPFRTKVSDREQLKVVKEFLRAGRSPLITVVSIMVYLASMRR